MKSGLELRLHGWSLPPPPKAPPPPNLLLETGGTWGNLQEQRVIIRWHLKREGEINVATPTPAKLYV